MMRRPFCLLIALLLALPAQARLQTRPAELDQGIRQVEEGDLDAAILTLDSAIQGLKGVPNRQADLALAHFYLGVSFLGVSQADRARTQFKEAWRNNKEMKPDPKSFPPRVMQAYEEAKAEASREAVPAGAAGAKGGGKDKTLLILGGLAAAGAGVALAGGSSPSTSSTPAVGGPQVLVSGGSAISAPNITTRFSAFTVPSAGVIQYTGNWTLAGSSFSLELGQNCGGFGPYVAESPVSSTRPLTLTHAVSAGGVYCPYAFYVSGAGGESFSYQIVFTPQ